MKIEYKAIFNDGCIAHSNTKSDDDYEEAEICFQITHDEVYVQTFDIVDRLVNGEHEQTEEWITRSDVKILASFNNGESWHTEDEIKEALEVFTLMNDIAKKEE